MNLDEVLRLFRVNPYDEPAIAELLDLLAYFNCDPFPMVLFRYAAKAGLN